MVSSVFAFAALSTGLFSADKSKGPIQAGLSEARGTLEMRGFVIAKKGSINVDETTFQVSNAAGDESVHLTPGETLVQYLDASQTVTLTGDNITVIGLGNADSDNLVKPGELYEVKVTGLKANLVIDLTKATKSKMKVKPLKGAVLHIERRTPVLLEAYMDLG